jgi:hypothetical protein
MRALLLQHGLGESPTIPTWKHHVELLPLYRLLYVSELSSNEQFAAFSIVVCIQWVYHLIAAANHLRQIGAQLGGIIITTAQIINGNGRRPFSQRFTIDKP